MPSVAVLHPTPATLAARADTNGRYAAALVVWQSPANKRSFDNGMAGHLVRDVHGMFRNWFHNLRKVVEQTTADATFQRKTTDEKNHWFHTTVAPKFQRGIDGLSGHHRGEDAHWFPSMRRSHPQLTQAFDVLENDHKELHPIEDVALSRDATFEDKCSAIVEFANFLEDHLRREEMLTVPILLQEGGR